MEFNITENDSHFIENLVINLKEIVDILKRNLLYDNSLKNIFNEIKYINSDINEDISIEIIKDNIHSLFPLLICSFLKKNSILSMVNFSDVERDEIFYFINDFVFNQYYFDIKYNTSFQANDYISNLYLTLFNTIKSDKEVNVFSINNYAFLNDVDGLMYKQIMNKLIFENKNFNLNDYEEFLMFNENHYISYGVAHFVDYIKTDKEIKLINKHIKKLNHENDIGNFFINFYIKNVSDTNLSTVDILVNNLIYNDKYDYKTSKFDKNTPHVILNAINNISFHKSYEYIINVNRILKHDLNAYYNVFLANHSLNEPNVLRITSPIIMFDVFCFHSFYVNLLELNKKKLEFEKEIVFEDGLLDFEKISKIDINYQNIILDTAKLFINYPTEVNNIVNLLLSLKYMENYEINTNEKLHCLFFETEKYIKDNINELNEIKNNKENNVYLKDKEINYLGIIELDIFKKNIDNIQETELKNILFEFCCFLSKKVSCLEVKQMNSFINSVFKSINYNFLHVNEDLTNKLLDINFNYEFMKNYKKIFSIAEQREIYALKYNKYVLENDEKFLIYEKLMNEASLLLTNKNKSKLKRL